MNTDKLFADAKEATPKPLAKVKVLVEDGKVRLDQAKRRLSLFTVDGVGSASVPTTIVLHKPC